ncbi:unnamed protein product [Plutella xylostella]|uniref:(diamondback moth) hypothetical protein n=1 Tax=Plutella xylostella TaxID=51655 RepID=A0A8S4FZ49_PLUXY|nr:unnamed protein product [Plutella xylostella]
MATLVLLDTLVQNYSNDISIDLLSKVLMEVPPLVCESDLHCAQTALALVRSSCLYCPHALNNDVRVALTPHILALAKSPLLQGGALKAMVGVLRALVAAGVPGCGRRELLALLVAPVQLQQHAGTAHATKQAFHSLAKCVAAVVVEAGGAEARAAVKQFLQDASEPSSDAAHMFALLAVAEIGKHLDLSTIPHIKDVLLASFTPSSEEVKSAASYALGSVAVGNLPELLPFILSEIDARPRRQYLLLHSLREPHPCYGVLVPPHCLLREVGGSYALGSVAVGNLPELLPFILSEIDARPRRQYLLLHSLREPHPCYGVLVPPHCLLREVGGSYALGSVAVGNLPELLPFILSEIDARPRRQYLLLHSLREIISCESCSPAGVAALRPFIPQIWVQLAKHCQCQEEGSRNVVAECLGKLCLLEPEELLPHLQEFLRSPEPLTRTTAVTAVKFTISDQPQAIDPLLRANMAELLLPLRDPALSVRRVALVAFNSAAHNKPSLIRDLLPRLLPTIYNETKVKKELIREVEMGPFKHSVDDGLDLRKAAFECMYTVLDTCLDRLDVFEFLRHVEDGLRDHYDIKMLTYLMCARLAQLCPSLVLQRLESLVEPLRATCTMKVKANSVKQEYEKQEELKRSALRAAAALMQIPEADKNPHLMDFVTQIKSFPELQPIFESMLKDSGAADSNMMDQS